jgi:prepilin-type N-terminal cleavage/methylation domain-containing protein/prepilin-type processing-associated H-X9-DG protein
MMKKSFTLIELLVVIAIIAILAGMLLPALNSAREKGRTSSCQGNAKQIGLALSLYNAAFDDFYPTSEVEWNAIGTKPTWSDVILPYIGSDISNAARYDRGGVFICPTQKSVKSSWKAYISYGINRDFVGRENYTNRTWASKKDGGVKASSVSSPSSQLIVTETWYSANRSTTIDIGNNVKVPARNLGYFVADQGTITFRHSRKNNTLYVDGHVAADDPSWLWMGHPLKYPWNVGNASSGNAFSLYPNRKTWEEERGYDPYY